MVVDECTPLYLLLLQCSYMIHVGGRSSNDGRSSPPARRREAVSNLFLFLKEGQSLPAPAEKAFSRAQAMPISKSVQLIRKPCE